MTTTYLGLAKPIGGTPSGWGTDSNANLDAVDAAASKITTTQQANDYTAVAADAGTCVEMTKATATTFTVPPNASVPFPIGTEILVTQYGAGPVGVFAGSGVTILAASSQVLRTQYSTISLRKRGTDEWVLSGDVFSPLDLSPVAWYDCSDISTLWKNTARTDAVTADADVIKGVTDKSGAGRHLSEATNGPAYKPAVLNGVARFDGTNDILAASGFSADASLTLFVVAKKASAPGASSKTVLGLGDDAQWFTHTGWDATHYLYYANEAVDATVLGGTATNWNAMALRFNSTASLDAYANGGTPTNLNPENGAFGVAYDVSTVMALGAAPALANFGDYDIGECLRYSDPLAATDMNAVGYYLASKWGLTWTEVS